MYRSLILPAVCVCLLLSISCASSLAGEVTTIAAAPFANITKDPDIDWLGAGFAETIATKLCKVSGIQYTERTQLSQALKELKLQDTALVDPATASKLGKLVGAKHVVIGSYQKAGEMLRVSARVVDVEAGTADRSADAVGTMDGVFDLQTDLARKLIEALGKTATESESKAVAEAPTKKLSAYEWYGKGVELQSAKKLSDAIWAYDRAIGLDPAFAEAYNSRGNAYHSKGDNNGAITNYNKAIELKPTCATYYSNRGVASQALGDQSRAIADYSKAIELDPSQAIPYFGRGMAYSATGDDDRAIADYSKAVELKPDFAEAYRERGAAYFGTGNYDGAIADLSRATELKPDDATAYYVRGRVYDTKGDGDKAIADYSKAVELRPDHAQAYYGRAVVYHHRNDKARAIADYRSFIQYAGADDARNVAWVKEKIAKLEKQPPKPKAQTPVHGDRTRTGKR